MNFNCIMIEMQLMKNRAGQIGKGFEDLLETLRRTARTLLPLARAQTTNQERDHISYDLI